MKILTVNAGSSSLKFSFFELPEEKEIIKGTFERIGLDNSFYSIKINGEKIKKECELKDHVTAIEYLKNELLENKVINSLDEIDGVGHRVVHAGDYYSSSVLINDEVVKNIALCNELAPLHNPANLAGIEAFQQALPTVRNVAVFDTAFHQTMEPERFVYPTPYEWYTEYGVRKYGFHGTSHRYIDKKMSEYLNKDNLKIISCHLGNGGSLCAIDSHKSIDTTMGFTPLAGLMMGTRSGDIDPGIIPFIMEKENKTAADVLNDLNKKSGFMGVTGFSSDNRDVQQSAREGNKRSMLSLDIYDQRVADFVAMYNNLLDGADMVCFTAGIGENSRETRESVCLRLKSLGIKLDEERNKAFGEFSLISADDSKIPVYVTPTNEELMIALDTYEIIK